MSINIINQYVRFSRKCINNYVKLAMGKYYDQDIFDELINVYIDVRYYDIYPRKYASTVSNINYYLSKKAHSLINEEQKTKKEEENIKSMFYIFYYILFFDNVMDCDSAKEVIKKLNNYRTKTFKIKNENFEHNLLEIVKQDLMKKKEYISNFETKDFEIIYKKTNVNNLYNVTIEHNLKFPKIYSKYAIDKIFLSNEINEQKLFIIYPIVAAKILSNIINSQFKKKYLIDYNISLNSKEKKYKRLFSLIDDDIAKEKIIIKINLTDFIDNKPFFIDNMKLGFNYAVILDVKTKLTAQNIEELKFFVYIIIKPSHPDFELISTLDNIVIDR